MFKTKCVSRSGRGWENVEECTAGRRDTCTAEGVVTKLRRSRFTRRLDDGGGGESRFDADKPRSVSSGGARDRVEIASRVLYTDDIII